MTTLSQKSNGSFSHEMQWLTNEVGRDFTGYTPHCKIKTKSGVLVHDFVLDTDMTWVSQSEGKLKLEVIDISSWPIALLETDLKFVQDSDSFKRVTATFNIKVEGGVS